MLRLALSFMDEWTPVSAETVAWILRYPEASQQEMADRFEIRQSAVSQRQKRARTDLVLELLKFYSNFYTEKDR
jgi:predicted transcriptional regulator